MEQVTIPEAQEERIKYYSILMWKELWRLWVYKWIVSQIHKDSHWYYRIITDLWENTYYEWQHTYQNKWPRYKKLFYKKRF